MRMVTIECQNNDLPACGGFYVAQGRGASMNRFAYPDFPGRDATFWGLRLSRSMAAR